MSNQSKSPSPRFDQSLAQDRLDSWKEIASYLMRDVRTVQRWEKVAGLPVHRLQVEKAGSVYAYKSELDTWYRERQRRLEEEPEREEGARASQIPRLPRWIAGALLAVVGLISLGVYFTRNSHWPRKQPVPGRIKLAVLPFQNLSGDPAQDYFTDGMTEEMISQLSRIHPARLGVIARTSAMLYKNTQKSTPRICRELDVDYILEGSVRRSGDRTRITAQLIQCSDQTHLWADSSERDMANIFALQADVAQAVAQNIQLALKPDERARLSDVRQVNPEAYQAYLRGLYFWNQYTPDSAQTAIKYFQTAIEKDPGYAPAYAGIANCYASPYLVRDISPREAFSRARTAATRAAALDDSSAEAHASLAVAKGYDWDWSLAEREYRRAIELNPNLTLAHLGYGHLLLVLRRPDEAWIELRTAQTLDPLSQWTGTTMVVSLYLSRRYNEAITLAKQWLELYPSASSFHGALAWVYTQQGLESLAIEEHLKAEELSGSSRARIAAFRDAAHKAGLKGLWRERLAREKNRSSESRVRAFDVAYDYAALGDRDQCFRWLEKAYAARDWQLLELGLEPGFDNLRSDPRFQDLLRRIGLPQ